MKKSSGFIIVVLVLIAGFFAVSLAQEARAASGLPDSFADLVEKSERTVVNIYTKQVVKLKNSPNEFFFHGQNELSDLFKYFFEFPGFQGKAPSTEREIKKTSLGSGVIISSDGYIVTNNHVVQDAEEIHVRSSEHEEYLAKIVGRDPKTDVALIKIETDRPLPYAEFGDSDKLRVGDWVIAIGNPFGFEQTVTAGIVSGKGRSIGHGPYENFIQTDASINPGNSGGPLFNTAGKMVGINTAIFSKNGGNMGIGFAIPINMANNVVSQLKEHGKVIRGWLGVLIQNVTPDLAAQFGLDKPIGALVGKVTEDGPADKAG
ncbi:MAG: trypsin-like peptidase domain-containing protein, partial [Desulfobulbaceae bacterium]|nr:trypsin-like peptidase domain-containing protein [Desulfobulbaceae bacterium]